ncbi:MAG TPA: hypothetical protein HA303_00940, partial [Candidatus Thalassarchaeaceae archaeon]|nr:hypothetical protein [Candidatus Thalassarchaeaceae archaeon]
MIASSKAITRRTRVSLTILVTALLLTPSMLFFAQNSSELQEVTKFEASDDIDLKLYTLYFA